MNDQVEVMTDPIATPKKENKMIGSQKMIRSVNAGVFWGKVVSIDDTTVVLRKARRVWYWDGAATLSELATLGTSKPQNCKFPARTKGEHIVLGVCEIIPMTEQALKSLNAVPAWTEHGK